LELIRTLGYVDNVMRDIRIESPDFEKLENVRREAQRNLKQESKTGFLLFLIFVSCVIYFLM
jgi:hypothetical protein